MVKNIVNGISYTKKEILENIVNIIEFKQGVNNDLTLLISKVSEAVNPNQINNHIGEGSTLDNYFEKQKGIRFIINGGFSHYKKNFYNWKSQDFNVGDPVGLIKIRNHIFEDYINLDNYGFLVQEDKGNNWKIVNNNNLNKNFKYILGCTPLLINNAKKIKLNMSLMKPMNEGEVNPPSVLGHGLQNHPRTAIGMKGETLYFINIENNNKNTGGCSLLKLQDIGVELNLDSLLNLDGGGSSQFKLIDSINNNVIENYVLDEDKKRILGHVLVIFDKNII